MLDPKRHPVPRRSRRLAAVAGALTLAVGAAGLARAQPPRQAVVFEDGRALEVARVERLGDSIELTLLEGGRIAVPAGRVRSWRPLAEPVADEPTTDVAPSPDEPWRASAGSFADTIAAAARAHRVDPALLTAMAQVESSFDPAAVSPKGASGLLQLMPATAERFGVADVFDVAQNVAGGARYMSWLLDYYGGDVELALAGYNAGEQAVDRHKGVPPYPETRTYVRKVLDGVDRLGGRTVQTPRGAPAP